MEDVESYTQESVYEERVSTEVKFIIYKCLSTNKGAVNIANFHKSIFTIWKSIEEDVVFIDNKNEHINDIESFPGGKTYKETF